MEKIKICVISNSGAVRNMLNDNLEELNYNVMIIINNKKGMEKLLTGKPDTIILDLNSLLKEGNRLIKELSTNQRIAGSKILIITSEDKLKQFELVSKIDEMILAPISIPELDLRLKKILKIEKPKINEKIIEVDRLIINPISYEVTAEDVPIQLTYKEFELLKLLVSNLGKVFTRESLLSIIWKYDFNQETRTIDNHIRRIRAKLGSKYASNIKTIRKVGYKFSLN